MRKVSNSTATIVILALAAGAALRLHSWRDADTTSPDWEYSSSESRRKLKHEKPVLAPHHKSTSFYDETWRELKRRGKYKVGSQKFNGIIRNRVSRQEALMIEELKGHYDSERAFDKAWRDLVYKGHPPGTPRFERLLERRGVRREDASSILNNVSSTLSKLELEVAEAAKHLNKARDDFEAATRYSESNRQLAAVEEIPYVQGKAGNANLSDGDLSRQGQGQGQVQGRRQRRRGQGQVEEPGRRHGEGQDLVQGQGQGQGQGQDQRQVQRQVQGQDQGQGQGVRGKQAMVKEADAMMKEIDAELETLLTMPLAVEEVMKEGDFEPLAICGRNADVGSVEDFAALQKYAQCPPINRNKPILLLEGYRAYGLTGNNLIEFLHAIQEARDMDISLGIMSKSWAMNLLLKMWMAIESNDWRIQFERAFCVKLFNNEKQLEGWDIVRPDTQELFFYRTDSPLDEYVASQGHVLRTLFRNYNTGEGKDVSGLPVQDMCSGINAIFGEKERSSAMYSVIHSRALEGEPGYRLLGAIGRRSGCDPTAALKMKPRYIRQILRPLGMMKNPIVVITDGQNSEVLDRLLADPEIGPLIRTVPEEAIWVGGDITLAIMANVFIGNPASTFTGFIAKSRLALGFGHNYLFRAKDENWEWKSVCGDECIFDKSIMRPMA